MPSGRRSRELGGAAKVPLHVGRTQGAARARAKSSSEVLFKVALKGRRIWRTIAMRGDQTLDQLHEEIFRAFDRFDDHLYTFYFPKAPRRRGPEVRPKEYVSPISFEDSGPEGRRFNAASTTVDELKLKAGQTFEYLFDYGDCWMHDVQVHHVGSIAVGRRYPSVLEKHGQSPPQYGSPE